HGTRNLPQTARVALRGSPHARLAEAIGTMQRGLTQCTTFASDSETERLGPTLARLRLAHPLADRGHLPGGLQLRADLPVPEDRRPNRRALDLRRLPGVAVLADRGRLRGRRASRGPARGAREPLRRRRAGVTVELRPVRRRARR